jgi:acetoin utilization deacetylase AcuC-like enzyme
MIPLPENHPFPMDKYGLVQAQLLYEGIIQPEQIISSPLAREEEVRTTHSPEYWQRIQDCSFSDKEIRKIGFPATSALRDRSLSSAGGTLLSARNALQYGIGINLAGGTHHAFTTHGEGYCVLNDIAIAATCLLAENQIRKALVVDLDVHQGNGTASIFHQDDRVFTFSIHCKDNYPMRKEVSDLDIELPAFTGDAAYLQSLYSALPEIIRTVHPDIIFYQSGVDVLGNDRLGKFNLSFEGLQARDRFVFGTAFHAQIPIVSVMGGGYHTSFNTLVAAHTETIKQAFYYFN